MSTVCEEKAQSDTKEVLLRSGSFHSVRQEVWPLVQTLLSGTLGSWCSLD